MSLDEQDVNNYFVSLNLLTLPQPVISVPAAVTTGSQVPNPVPEPVNQISENINPIRQQDRQASNDQHPQVAALVAEVRTLLQRLEPVLAHIEQPQVNNELTELRNQNAELSKKVIQLAENQAAITTNLNQIATKLDKVIQEQETQMSSVAKIQEELTKPKGAENQKIIDDIKAQDDKIKGLTTTLNTVVESIKSVQNLLNITQTQIIQEIGSVKTNLDSGLDAQKSEIHNIKRKIDEQAAKPAPPKPEEESMIQIINNQQPSVNTNNNIYYDLKKPVGIVLPPPSPYAPPAPLQQVPPPIQISGGQYAPPPPVPVQYQQQQQQQQQVPAQNYVSGAQYAPPPSSIPAPYQPVNQVQPNPNTGLQQSGIPAYSQIKNGAVSNQPQQIQTQPQNYQFPPAVSPYSESSMIAMKIQGSKQ